MERWALSILIVCVSCTDDSSPDPVDVVPSFQQEVVFVSDVPPSIDAGMPAMPEVSSPRGDSSAMSEVDSPKPSDLGSQCGNGTREAAEACDDGNTFFGDGCRPDCTIEGPYQVGAIVITELMADPKVVSDKDGEWIELHNPGDSEVDLRGWQISVGDDGGSVFTVPGGGTPIVIGPMDFLLVGVNDSLEVNGGASVSVVWASLTLPNSTPQPIRLFWNAVEIDAVDFSDASFSGSKSGQSLSLDPAHASATGNNSGDVWCVTSTATYGLGDRGTPNGVNEACNGAVCGDGTQSWGEQCDDGNLIAGDGCEIDCTTSQDTDGDGVVDTLDNCPKEMNPAQEDLDGDGYGDVCDIQDCGNNQVEGSEECDDGGLVDGDGCTANCTVELAGAMVISEIMIDPVASSDSKGEWIELSNVTPYSLDLIGWTLSDASKSHTISTSVVVSPGASVVLGRSSSIDENGGAVVNYVYGKDITLNQTADTLTLFQPNSAMVDQVTYDKSFSITKAASLSLDPAKFSVGANDVPSAWCVSTTPFGAGDLGTPGTPNLSCE